LVNSAWTCLTLVVLPVLLIWAGLALFSLVFMCDENCPSPTSSQDWRYTGQAFLAAPGIVAGLIGLGLGFSRHRATGAVFLGVSAFSAISWLGMTSSLLW
jgi:hypothetical protein